MVNGMSTPRTVVVDADGHLCEPADLWETGPPGAPARSRDPPAVERRHRLRRVLVEDRMATERGLVGPRQRGHSRTTTSARARTTRT